MTRNLFIEKDVVCPVCHTSYSLKYPNPKLYVAANRDADRRVTAYTWAQGIQSEVIPHYYAVAQCPQCLYADLKENIESPRFGTKEKKVYEARNNLDLKRVLLLKRIRRIVPEGTINLEGAIALHLGAIFCALLPEKAEDIDHNKLGRLYLRLSWLYGEQKSDSPAAAGEESTSPTLELLYKNVEGLHSNLLNFVEDLNSTRKLIGERARELGLPVEGEHNPYFSIAGAISDKMNEIQTLVEMLQQSVSSDKNGNLRPIGLSANGLPASWQRQLAEIALKWPNLPRSEETCIKRTVEAFDYSIKYEDTEHSIEQSLSIVNLIIKLLLKIGDLENALDYISKIYKSGFRDKQDLQRRLSQGKQEKTLTDFDERNILRKIATINNTLAQAGDTRKKILALVYEKNKERILSLLKENIERPASDQEKALRDAGINEELIPFLREKGLMKSEETAKKGWFAKKINS